MKRIFTVCLLGALLTNAAWAGAPAYNASEEINLRAHGIPADERDRIWSPFFTTKETGTGLGLALSRKAVEAHGGRLELESQEGRGSLFRILLPGTRGGTRVRPS